MKLIKDVGYSGLEDTSIDVMYIHLFVDSLTEKVLPSIVSIRHTSLEIIEYFKNSKEYLPLATNVSVADYYPENENGYFTEDSQKIKNGSEDITYFFYKLNGKFPLLIKVTINGLGESVYFMACSVDNDTLQKLYQDVKKRFSLKYDNKRINFGVIYQNSGGGLQVKKFPLNDNYSSNLDITLNYGSSFKKHHDAIVSRLSEFKQGLFIFNGKPGTGKTTYIKYLAKLFSGKRTFIFIPITFIDSLVSPALIPLLLQHKDSVLVLEDAEKAVVSRNKNIGNESLVSSLLNIGDGILGSMLNISLIITFNTSKDGVDEALLRKGRLLYEYAFDTLSVEDSKNLLKKLNKSQDISAPMTLADIYNFEISNNNRRQSVKSQCV